MNFKIGDTIGAYRLLAECGQGAYGTVFFAESTVTHRRVALKVVYRHGRNCERELRGLGRYQLICPRTGLLQVYHVEDCGEYFYYTMDAADDLSHGGEYVPDTLANRLRASGRLPAEAVRTMADELVECINTLHGKGLLHRDVKPDNILWIDGAAKLGDIGLVATDGATVLAGTPGFLPPEVLAGTRDYEPKDDFYALGKAIYCALTGMPVEKFPSFPDSRTLGGCGDLVVLYNRLCRGEPVPPRPVVEERRRRAQWFAVAAVVAVVCLCAVVWFALRPKPVPPSTTTAPEQSAAPPVVSSSSVPKKATESQDEQSFPENPGAAWSPKKYDLRKLDFMKKTPAQKLDPRRHSANGFAGERKWHATCSYYLGVEEHPEVTAAGKAPPSDKRAARVRELGAWLKEYAVSPEFLDIFPQVIAAANELEAEWRAMPRNTDAEKDAADLFHEGHSYDPEVWFERETESVYDYTVRVLKLSEYESGFRDALRSLKILLRHRKQLEAELLKKYKGKGAESAPGKKSE